MDKSAVLIALADDTLLTISERNRCKSENIDHESHDITIQKNFERLRNGIKTLERDLSAAEESGSLSSKELKEREDNLIRLTKQVESLESLMGENHDISARELLLGLNASTEPRKTKTVRFSDQIVEPDELDNSQVLQLQQRIIQDQDADLDRLDVAIGRQREIGLRIGEELDYHVELLEDTESLVDRTDSRLNKAKRNLGKVSRKVKEHKLGCLVFLLILILFVLVAI
ncbi:3033_t:CDS:2 [Paraglomus brasilianum]|uniref:3033_t:CDS:1 n=1 Tax=Paraglomus brasilianum TaxID=144538 RepID=A0A9N9D9Z1_9GLOM|nr:3033_t:CDS:2 [Paraglomus brasilianum]